MHINSNMFSRFEDMLGKRPPIKHRPRYSYSRQRTPSWFIFLIGVALVFGVYYVWLGVRDFLAETTLTVQQATRTVAAVITSTAQVVATRDSFTPFPTPTPIPECTDFVVRVPRAIVRRAPNTGAEIIDTYTEGTVVCVIGRAPENLDWYLIDTDRASRRINAGYMFQDIIAALNPTPTPSATYTAAPTVTPAPTYTPSDTPTPTITPTLDPQATPTRTITPTPTSTAPVRNV
jgi:hypothetical protein